MQAVPTHFDGGAPTGAGGLNSVRWLGEREKRETQKEPRIMDVSDLTFFHPTHRAAALR